MELAGALSAYWETRAYFTEGRNWLNRALSLPDADITLRLRALNAAGRLAEHQGDVSAATSYFEEGIALAGDEDKEEIAELLANLGGALRYQGNYRDAQAFLERSVRISRELDDDHTLAVALNNRGILEESRGNHQTAKT